MNPFLAFLAIIPLIGFGSLLAVFIFNSFKNGLRWDFLPVVTILGGLSWYLIRFLRKTATPEGALLQLPGEKEVNRGNILEKTMRTSIIIGMMYISIGLCIFFYFQHDEFRNLIGSICLLIAVALLWSGVVDLTSGLKSLSNLGNTPEGKEVLERISLAHRTIRNSLLFNPIFGIIIFWWYNLDGFRYFSRLDLFGFLSLLGSFLVWAFLRDSALQKLKQRLSTSQPS